MFAVHTLLVLWFEVSKLHCALASFCMKYLLYAELLEPKTPLARFAVAYEAVHIYIDTSEHEHE